MEPLVMTVCVDRESGQYFFVTSSGAETQADDLRLLGNVVLELSRKFTETRVKLAETDRGRPQEPPQQETAE